MGKMLAGLFVGVFVGAVGYELFKKTEFARTAGRKLSEGIESAKKAFEDGYPFVAQSSEEMP